MINVVAFVIAACVYLFTWAMGVKGLTAALIPAGIIITAAAIYTYKPLLHKTVHGEESK